MRAKQNITVRVARQAPIELKIDRDEEAVYRMAESYVNGLFETWLDRFEDKTSEEVLARVAFRFARLYAAQQVAYESADEVLNTISKDLEEALLATE